MRTSDTLCGVLIDHLKAVRIPLLIIGLAVLLTFWVDQVAETFLLLVTDFKGQTLVAATLSAGILGFAIWHTSRTVYRFDVPANPTLSDPRGEPIREWLPRALGAAVPLLMAVGCFTALNDPALRNSKQITGSLIPGLFLAEAALLLAFFMVRRRVFRKVSSLGSRPSADPRVTRWSQLPKSVRRVYGALLIANVVALVAAALLPGELSKLGTLSVILICASFLTTTGTYLTVQAARLQIPLLSLLFLWACLLQGVGVNDNHHVRMYEGMNSDDTPKAHPDDSVAAINQSFATYAAQWRNTLGDSEPIYIVSAEGGGIRAAAWTALVLTELEERSNGQFAHHMLFGSGVSGGSLGLALFAAMIRSRDDGAMGTGDFRTVTESFLTKDYLGPSIETMFLTDFLQRFVPHPVFIDRGERLELGWEEGWTDVCVHRPSAPAAAPEARPSARDDCKLFSRRWQDLWNPGGRVPALFLNSTDVQSGKRFIQQPFSAIDDHQSSVFDAAIDSAKFIPASIPLSSVVHNSARFTYVSPAGTLAATSRRRDSNDSAAVFDEYPFPRQLVDGGYFENSGTTTLAELAAVLSRVYPECATGVSNPSCPLRFVHISNDPSIRAMVAEDSCTDTPDARSPAQFGEIRAPVIALSNTRDARGATAREFAKKSVYQPRHRAVAARR